MLYARIGEGQISAVSVARRFTPEKEGLAERLVKGPLEALGVGRKPTGGVRIQGIDNVMVQYARCCQPVPGDPVVGIVTIGRGVSVHRQDCPNTFGDKVPAERRAAVEWDSRPSDTFPVRLVSSGQDRPPLLGAGEIGAGLRGLLGLRHRAGEAEARWLAGKIAGLRVFGDVAARMNLDVRDVGGAVLVVPPFTLYGDTPHGRRPDFTEAAHPE